MNDYRDSTPLFFAPPAKESRGDGQPMYPDKFPELVGNGRCEHCGVGYSYKPNGSNLFCPDCEKMIEDDWRRQLFSPEVGKANA